MKTLKVEHTTVYRYARPVAFGEHRLMFRPRDSHDLKLLDASVVTTPPAQLRWYHDQFSNSIAIADFEAAADQLRLASTITIEHYGLENPEFPIEAFARSFPFSYVFEEIPDLARMIERHYPDPDRRVDAWARAFVAENTPNATQNMLESMTRAVKDRFGYVQRHEPGTRTPVDLLDRGSGTCRDLALFLMEATRSLGLAARFVSGYLYDPALDGEDQQISGAGSPHAWVQVYLPGAGWVELDPTNGLIGGQNLIRVAVVRDPSQAIPIRGTYSGAAEDFLEMSVDVVVRRI
jgi:transglutaminase-like putative cysteine protease